MYLTERNGRSATLKSLWICCGWIEALCMCALPAQVLKSRPSGWLCHSYPGICPPYLASSGDGIATKPKNKGVACPLPSGILVRQALPNLKTEAKAHVTCGHQMPNAVPPKDLFYETPK